MHLGDIKNGSSQCTDTYFQSIRSSFDTFADPLSTRRATTSGPTATARTTATTTRWSGLQKLRQLFFDNPGRTLGQNSERVRSQTNKGFPENVRWRRNDIQFGVINLPGSNNDLAPWTGAWGDGLTVGPVQQAEHDSRLAANLDWIDGIFQRAERHRTAPW